MEQKSMTVTELKEFLVGKEIQFTPYSQEQIDTKKEEIGGMPALLEEYYLTIGWFPNISNQGYGCHIDKLEDISILTADEIHEDYEGTENEVDDYLVFGREAVSVDEFALKVKDFNQADPDLYIAGDSTFDDTEEEALFFGTLEEEPYLSSMFVIIKESLE